MTSGQRKAHKYIWLLLLICIPIGIYFSVKDLSFSSEKTLASETEITKKDILKTVQNEVIKITTYKKVNSIEIILKTPLKNATSVAYLLNKDFTKGKFIGQLATVGVYNFNIDKEENIIGIAIYDALKETLITKLTF